MEDSIANSSLVSNNKVFSSRLQSEVIQQISHHADSRKDTVNIMEKYLLGDKSGVHFKYESVLLKIKKKNWS
jgi:hypothetical protein